MIEKEQEVLLAEQASVDFGVVVFVRGQSVGAVGRRGAVILLFVAFNLVLELVFSEHVLAR
jgi:hypothetical protein